MELANLLRTLVDEKVQTYLFLSAFSQSIKVNGKMRRLGMSSWMNARFESGSPTMTDDRYQVYVDSRRPTLRSLVRGSDGFVSVLSGNKDFPGCSIRRIETVIPTCEELISTVVD